MADPNCFFNCDVAEDEPAPTTFDDDLFGEPTEEVVDEVESDMDMDMDDDMEMEMAMEDMDEEDMDEMSAEMKNELRMANLAFLAMAGMSTTWAAIDLFFWKWQVQYTGTTSDGSTPDAGQVYHFASEYAMISSQNSSISTGYWRLGALIGDYATLAIMGVATITQLLSMFGIAASVNMMVWMWGVMVGGGIVSMVVGAMWMWAYRAAMSDLSSDSTTNAATTISADGTAAALMASSIEMDMVKAMAHEASATLTAWEYMESWMKAQYHALTPEQQEMWKEEHEGEMSSDMEMHHDGDHHEGAETTDAADETDEEGESQDAPEPETAEEEETGDFDDLFMLFKKKVFRF